MLKDDDNEKNKVKNVLKQHYRKIRYWYKHYASMDCVTANAGFSQLPIWTVSENRFLQIFEDIDF